jgi:radical SAM protein with 4Fe4S-binding SPASM domain
MFDYRYFKDFLTKLIASNGAPLQLELQPGKGCGGYDCRFCYGYKQKLTTGRELTLDDYYRLLDDVKGRVKLITLAGIKSDPLNNRYAYEIIRRIKENGFRLGVHTKGFLLNRRISDLLNNGTAYGDFITLSIDASDPSTYNRLHGLPKRARFFDIVRENMNYLYRRKMKTASQLNVNASYLLFQCNTTKEAMENFVRQFGESSDVMRFSPPQLPNKVSRKPRYYLSSLACARKIIEHLKDKYPKRKIVFLDFDDHGHNTSFRYCYAQRFLAVIDPHGYVYPCPQITTMKFKRITYGNIKNNGFWEIWDSPQRKRILDMEAEDLGCRICDRKDEALNVEMSRIFNNEKIS